MIGLFQKSWYGEQSRWISGYNGLLINLRHLKYISGGSKKIKDTMISFKKDPNVKITFYQHLNSKGDCVDVTGIGNVGNVGRWNDTLSSIGFGTACPYHRRRSLP